jgi:cell division protein FtsW
MHRHINYYFLGLSIFLTGFGLLFLSTLSAISSLQIFGNTNYYLFHQLIAVIIGLVFGTIAFKVPLSFLKKIAPILLLINLVALVIVFLPLIGTKLWGASRWLNIGGLSLQPSEFFKVTAIIYLSAWLSNKFTKSSKKGWIVTAKKEYDTFIKAYVPFLIFLATIVVIFYFQRDITTLGIITVTLIVVYFEAGTPLWNTIATITVGIGGALILIIKEPYRFERLLIFLHPETDP